MSLADVLARMLPNGAVGYVTSDNQIVKPFLGLPDALLATPEGRALAALVEAAMAWYEVWGADSISLPHETPLGEAIAMLRLLTEPRA